MDRLPFRRSPKHTPPLIQTVLARLGSRVVEARKLQDLTQEQLASISEISVSTLRALENGSDGVSLGNLLKVMQGLKLLGQVEDLVDPQEDVAFKEFAMRGFKDR